MENDGKDVALSPFALEALASFYADKDAREKQFEDLKAQAEDEYEQTHFSMDAFTEDWNASQFWLLEGATKHSNIAVVSAPSVFIQLKNLLADVEASERPTVKLLEYDERFAVFKEFVFYDFAHPLKLSEDLKGRFDRIICDPPFLSADCQTKAAMTVRWLSRPSPDSEAVRKEGNPDHRLGRGACQGAEQRVQVLCEFHERALGIRKAIETRAGATSGTPHVDFAMLMAKYPVRRCAVLRSAVQPSHTMLCLPDATPARATHARSIKAPASAERSVGWSCLGTRRHSKPVTSCSGVLPSSISTAFLQQRRAAHTHTHKHTNPLTRQHNSRLIRLSLSRSLVPSAGLRNTRHVCIACVSSGCIPRSLHLRHPSLDTASKLQLTCGPPACQLPAHPAGDDAHLQARPPLDSSPLSASATNRSGYQITPGTDTTVQRSSSMASTKVNQNGAPSPAPARSNTLSKRTSLRKRDSLKRTKSGRSLRAGSMKGLDDENFYSVFHTPIPTSGSPTDTLANRFTAWRKVLKDLIGYFREIQSSYESRSKSLVKLQNVISGSQAPQIFLSQGGIDEANTILRNYHKHAVSEAKRAQDIETDVINQLSGLRSELGQKIKEIKSLSGDFKNSVDKEKDHTRKVIAAYEDALATAAHDPTAAAGKNDPFIVRLQVEKQVERQIEEENYLHRAYLNLEGSGRELESIVIGEIQKAYNAYASILKREADANTSAVEELRSGPIAMPKDHEWTSFVESDSHFVSPSLPIRRAEQMEYPGKFDPAAAEIRAGNLERKSKYLKSYTAGWYVLSPTHLHEFKSPDDIHLQQPVMSLCLVDQKLGSHSNAGSSSDKFSLKGAQTGGMHRGHSWVFRAESYDTMMAWYNDIRILTDKSGPEKTAFIRQHARSVSGGSRPGAPSVSSDGIEDDEADSAPFSANMQQNTQEESLLAERPKRPEPGGRFPSDFDVSRASRLQAPLSPSSPSGSSEFRDSGIENASAGGAAGAATGAAAAVAHNETDGQHSRLETDQTVHDPSVTAAAAPVQQPIYQAYHPSDHAQQAAAAQNFPSEMSSEPRTPPRASGFPNQTQTSGSNDDWLAPAAGGAAIGVLGGAAAATALDSHHDADQPPPSDEALPVQEVESPVQAERPEEPVIANTIDGVVDGDEPAAPAFDVVPAAALHTTAPDPEGESFVAPLPHETNSAATAADDAIPGDPHAHRTHQLFPSVIRHDTSTSISQLHVPGEFPPSRHQSYSK
ncbi:hypothetical protein FH972_026273 [Carpinus fangiana]|uniref:PH domain-containing protein n=1 Tax=Carpinus fangiana TaxID=176857 RepID=A0A5N6L3H4_9ROSI|nr:hypothetical protein FH972_026273 [Carpinus fangiana]